MRFLDFVPVSELLFIDRTIDGNDTDYYNALILNELRE